MKPHRVAPATAADVNDSAYWKAVKTGDFVGIRDVESFSAGNGSAPDFTVGEVRSFAILGPDARASGGPSSGEYRFIELLQEDAGPLYLSLVEAEGGFELRLYFSPDGLAGGTRDELIDRGDSWLFLPPPNPDDFISSELEYAPWPDLPEIEEGGTSRKLVFGPKGPGKSLYGEARDTQRPVITTEYIDETPVGGQEPANPLFLVLEEGWMASDGSQPEEGGYLTMMLGKVIPVGDIEHFPSG